MQVKISTVIVTYNGVKWINKCINSIFKSSVEVSIIVVDNNSTDNTVSFIESNFKNIYLIRSKENLGFGRGNNIGIKYALNNFSPDFIFLLNQDAYIERNTIKNLVNSSLSNKEYGVLSPIHLNGDGSDYDENFLKYVNKKKGNGNGNFEKAIKLYSDQIYDVPFVNAAAWLLPINTIKTVGGFDPIFYHYGEDDNYCQRVHFHNLKIGIVPNSKIYHDRIITIMKIVPYSEAYFKFYERSIKTLWANIIVDSINTFVISEKKKFKIDFLKALIRLNFNNIKGIFKKKRIFKRSLKEIKRSRNINKGRGLSYLK